MTKKRKSARYRHTCEKCGTIFLSAKRIQRYCSHVCSTKGMHDEKAVDKPCPHCGRIFSGVITKTYCSAKCRRAAKWLRTKHGGPEQDSIPHPTYGFWNI